MSQAIKIATIRGAGLSFPIACLHFVFFGQPTIFTLILAGALAGFVLGTYFERYPNAKSAWKTAFTRERTKTAGPGVVSKGIFHDHLWLRFLTLLGVATGLFLLAWITGYFLLPEGIFHGGAQAQMARGALDTQSSSVLEEWVKIFRANLLPVVLILAGSILIRVNRVSMGYLVVFVNVIGYGLFLGTNSFAIPMPERMAPSFSVLARSGPYEMLALILIAAGAYRWTLFEIKRIFITNPERITNRPKVSTLDILAVVLGLCILAAANWREAVMVVAASL